MSKKSNQRADVKNPNNDAYKADIDNRAGLLNPEINKLHPLNIKEEAVEIPKKYGK